MRTTYRYSKHADTCYDVRNGHNYEPTPPDKRSDLAAPYIIQDEQRPLRSMADGELYTSKRKMRQGYKDRGFEEVGDDASYTTEAKNGRRVDWADEAKEHHDHRLDIRASVDRSVSRLNLTSRKKDELPTR